MCCKNSILKIVVFGIGLALGLAVVALFTPPAPSFSFDDALARIRNSGGGIGISGPDFDKSPRVFDDAPDTFSSTSSGVKIVSKPKAAYTDEARNNNTQGSVTLKITFLASGEIGDITVVSGLPHGLTEQAIAAARQIKFEPKHINGQPVTVTMTFQYGFNIY